MKKELIYFMLVVWLFTMLAACGSGGGGGSDNGGGSTSTEDNIAGKWMWSRTDNSSCNGVSYESGTFTITQNGSNISVYDAVANRKLTGTISGNTISFSGSFAEYGGTTNATATLTLSADKNSCSGGASWTWTGPSKICTGTKTYTAFTRTSTPDQSPISITPSSPSMLVGGSMNLKVERTLADNTVEDLTNYADVVWSTSNEAVVSLGNMGIIHAKGEGAATITASYRGEKGIANVSVTGLSKKLILYFVTTEDTSQYIPGHGTIDSNYQKLIRYVPDAGIMDILGSYQSYSYGGADLVPYTVDNRLFVRSDSTTTGDSSVSEIDPLTQKSIQYFLASKPSDGCSAVVDNYYFYETPTKYNPLYGYVGGNFVKLTLPQTQSSDHGTTLFNRINFVKDVYDRCRGNLAADNGVLYDADIFTENSTTYLEIYKRDLGTGRINTAASKSWTVTDTGLYWYSPLSFVFDNGNAYWISERRSDHQIEIWQSDFVSDTPTLIYSGFFSDSNPALGVSLLDASNGYLAIGKPGSSQEVMIIEVSTGASRIIDLGIKNYNNLQILYLP